MLVELDSPCCVTDDRLVELDSPCCATDDRLGELGASTLFVVKRYVHVSKVIRLS